MHLNDTANTLFLLLNGVIHTVTRFQNTRVDADKGQRTNEGVGGDLKRQGRKRCTVVRFAGINGAVFIVELTFDRLNFRRRRHVFDNAIQHCLNAFVLKGRTTGN